MTKHEQGMLLYTEKVALDTYELVIEASNAKRNVVPGQFVHLQVPKRPDLLMRRPISINTVDKTESTYKLIVQAYGEGTKVLCSLPPNTILDIVGPVGRGFFLHKDAKKVAVVGGGLGVAPLRYLIEKYPEMHFSSFLGFRSKKHAYQIPVFKSISDLYLHTDDGSSGKKGFATDTLENMLKTEHFDAVCACGPTPMFRTLQSIMSKYDIPCYISMEERMGCGIGACKTCVCKTVEDGIEDYKKVCQDGPVFDIGKVVL